MERVFLSGCVLGLALSLSACGGGSGGSRFSTDDMHKGATTRSAPDMSTAEKTASALVSPGSDLQDDLAGAGVRLNQFGTYRLKAEPNGVRVVDFLGATVAAFDSSKIKFYSMDGIDFAVIADVKPSVDINTVIHLAKDPFIHQAKGLATEKLVGWLGKLDYVSFGYWAQVWDFRGTLDDAQFKGSFVDEAGVFFNGRKANYVASLENSRFTGLAAGIAEFSEVIKNYPDDIETDIKGSVIPLLGTATLDIKKANGGVLTLEFPDFYKFTGSVAISLLGSISGRFTGLTNLGSGFNLPAIHNSGINGQLYGASPNNPSEAAGSWHLSYGTINKDVYIQGTFGVKK